MTGWAIAYGNGRIESGTAEFKNGRYEGGGMRFVRARSWLLTIIPTVDLIYYEEVRRHKGVDAAHIYGGLLSHVTGVCEELGKPYAGIPVGTIKRHATGKGNANKAAMIRAMMDKGHKPEDDNEADALALLHYALELNQNLAGN